MTIGLDRLGLWTGAALLLLFPLAAAAEVARGVVFHDLNGNGVHDPGEPPIAGVAVSNGLEVVVTDEEGHWELPVEGDTVIFMIKPSGYAIGTDGNMTPQFHFIHRPDGSPDLRYSGVEPTGPLPESIDFALRETDEPEDFRVLLFADPQVRNFDDVDYFLRSTIGEVRDTAQAAFGMTLGDLVHNNLNLLPHYIDATALIGIPFYGVIGNHDMNFDAPGDFYAGETYIRHYGPRTYAFNVGKVHFIAMDNIIRGDSGYQEGFRRSDMEWLRNNLEHVPEENLVVLATHSPIWRPNPKAGRHFTRGSERLFEALRDRAHILAVSGHTHYNAHRTFGPEDGWHGDGHFHQMNIATISGGWWEGPADADGIPIRIQRDGSPPGYVLLDFEGIRYTPHFRAIGMPASHQMRIHPPREVRLDDSAAGKALSEFLLLTEGELANPGTHKLLVNVFDGVMDAEVSFRLNGGDRREMTFSPQHDPIIERVYHEGVPVRRKEITPRVSHHMWEAYIASEELPEGANLLEVVYRDSFGREFRDTRAFLRRGD